MKRQILTTILALTLTASTLSAPLVVQPTQVSAASTSTVTAKPIDCMVYAMYDDITVPAYKIKGKVYIDARALVGVKSWYDRDALSMELVETKGKIEFKTTKRLQKGVSLKAPTKSAKAKKSTKSVYLDDNKTKIESYIINSVSYVDADALLDALKVEYYGENTFYQINLGLREGNGEGKTVKIVDIFEDAALVEDPNTVEDFERVVIYMLQNDMASYTFDSSMQYGEHQQEGSATQNFLKCMKYNYTYNFSIYGEVHNWKYTIKGTENGTSITLYLSNSLLPTLDVCKTSKAFFTETKKIVQNLIDEGVITSSMTQREKAKVCYEYVIHRVEYAAQCRDDYETEYDKDEIEHFGYAAISDNFAVCSGYASLYDLMCQYLGIECTSVFSASMWHRWTAQILDGERVMTDTTWGDKGISNMESKLTYSYFAIPVSKMAKDHKWVSAEYPEWD